MTGYLKWLFVHLGQLGIALAGLAVVIAIAMLPYFIVHLWLGYPEDLGQILTGIWTAFVGLGVIHLCEE